MATVKEHYDSHLGNFYSWMMGDLTSRQDEFQHFLIEHELLPRVTGNAIDLGAGHGIQTVPLAKVGYSVKSLDFNIRLLNELTVNTKGMNVEICRIDIREIQQFYAFNPELIVCCGDTLLHLDNKQDIEQLLHGIANILVENGKLLLTFRDYSTPLTENNRFIPIRSDENRILTCILDYETDFINVTDLLYEKNTDGWEQKISFYKKVRVKPDEIVKIIEQNNMTIQYNQTVNKMITIIACKKY
jgi:2-polyprenyl-3-methyl-5-hydroxy-6-metoxy-1,4-benzoquinol methylase